VQSAQKETHTSIQVQRKHSLRNGFTACFVLSPVNGSFATVVPEKLASHELDASTAASEPHDFAVRVGRLRLARLARPSHLTARSWRSRPAPRLPWDARIQITDLPDEASAIFLCEGLDRLLVGDLRVGQNHPGLQDILILLHPSKHQARPIRFWSDFAQTTSAGKIVLALFRVIRQVGSVHFLEFSMDRVQAGYVQLVLHDDEHTRQDFVIGLLRSVFSQSPTDALEVMMTIESKGKAVCGTYRRVVADALLQAAQERIRTAGHQLVMTAEAGDDLGVIVASCAAILQVTSSV
jgi:ATP-dependent Clp protease adapter protein ClpS